MARKPLVLCLEYYINAIYGTLTVYKEGDLASSAEFLEIVRLVKLSSLKLLL